eukprot:CAMPEP_0178468482 /NCGR_PEP_ID=MMETSP0689_2-20121128/52940_1 /TAXON_ID=160604 /ORGANISM="Amphidinium massartii, Strain CS-259" /LENGTH=576 /DNA_ID=CAMNT_0020095535 /DNA_START=69 /DNA_END=1799 /DNA_ORIENTATION=+
MTNQFLANEGTQSSPMMMPISQDAFFNRHLSSASTEPSMSDWANHSGSDAFEEMLPGASLGMCSFEENPLSRLGPLASQLACVVAHSELSAADLVKLGFQVAETAEAVMQHGLRPLNPDVMAVCVITSVADAPEAQEVMHILAQDAAAPVLLAVVTPGFSRQSTPSMVDGRRDVLGAQASMRYSHDLKSIRSSLMAYGADGVITLMQGELLLPHRLMDTIEQCEFVATKVTKLMDERQREAEESAAKKVQAAFRRFLGEMPGRALENVPRADPGVEERFDGDNKLVGVAGFEFVQLLGAGAFGSVFKALDAKTGFKAVKVMPKAAFKSAGMLISLDQEVSIMRFMKEHPNVVRAQTILHAHHHFYLVMEYAGEQNLHAYTKAVVQKTGAPTLHPEMIARFSCQQASAVEHLHASLVCHRDIKPTNWIVADGGDVVRLSDFGLAAQLNGPEHRLHTCCGSLPFCAPEVLSARHEGEYHPLMADTWSLAVGFVELLSGPFGVEKLIGWGTQRPTEDSCVVEALRSMPSRWQEARKSLVHPVTSSLVQVIGKMLKRVPTERWSMRAVVSEQGLSCQCPA